MISLRRMSLGAGYRYLMESVAAGDGVRRQSTNLADYYAESGTPPGVFLGAGLGALDDGRGVEKGSAVSEEHLFNLLGMCADPVTGKALGRPPNRSHLSLATRMAERVAAIAPAASEAERAEQKARIEAEERAQGRNVPRPRGRVRPHLLALQVGLGGLGPGRPGDQGADLRLPPPGHRRRADLRRARGVPLALGQGWRGPRGRRGCGGHRVHPLGLEGRRPPASRPCRGGQPGPLRL